jgi:hydrogenase 3 maturation protease
MILKEGAAVRAGPGGTPDSFFRNLRLLFQRPGIKILCAGVGNLLRKDDGVGVHIAGGIIQGSGISSLLVEMGIENYIGKINRLAPDLLVIIDACDFNEPAGFCRLAEPHELQGITTNTHNISLLKLSEFFDMPVRILGIQPSCTGFGETVSSVVDKRATEIINIINDQIINSNQ